MPGLLSKRQLESPLREDLTHLRFSPDGKYILAQDNGGISVLAREPFATLFRIEAAEISTPQFTPDSQGIVFYNSDLRVQHWSVTERKLKSAQDVVVPGKFCLQSSLSPDGKTLACLDTDYDLALFEVATSKQIFRKKDFYEKDYFDLNGVLGVYLDSSDSSISVNYNSLTRRTIHMNFSPDGRYFAAGARNAKRKEFLESNGTVSNASKGGFPNEYEYSANEIAVKTGTYRHPMAGTFARTSDALAYDLSLNKQVSLGGSIKHLLAGGFTFINSSRIVGTHPLDRAQSALAAFPSGEVVKPLPLDRGRLDAPGHGEYVLFRPRETSPSGIVKVVMNLKDGNIFKASKKLAIDIYDDVFVAELANGELGLYGSEKNDLRAKASLPGNPLGDIYAAALSPDFKWLAVSGKSRGAVWDLSTGERVFHVRGFRGAHYAEDGAFYVDFPPQGTAARQIGILQTQRREALSGAEIESGQEIRARQHGQYLFISRPGVKESGLEQQVSLEVKDVQTMKTLWSKTFLKNLPTGWMDARGEMMVLMWPLSGDAAKEQFKKDLALSKRLSAVKEKDGSYVLEMLDARTGQQRGILLIEMGRNPPSFAWEVFAVGDRAVIVDSNNRVLVYSLADGEQKGQIAGSDATVSKTNGLLCVRSTGGQLAVYDLATMQKREQFVFPSPVSLARFSDDGTRMFVLTAAQTAYVLDVSKLDAAGKL